MIINNGSPAGTTQTSEARSEQTQNRQSVPPAPLTPEQKIHRTEQLAEEAKKKKNSSIKWIGIAVILLVVGIFFSSAGREDGFEKAALSGTKDVGFVTDEGFFEGHYRTEEACRQFYEKTGIPLYVYAIETYPGDADTCDEYANQLYDRLFSDENHALLVYYDNVDWWSWCTGEHVASIMTDYEINNLIDDIYVYWDNTSYRNDEVFAKGITDYTEDLISEESGAVLFAYILYVAAAVIAVAGIISLLTNAKEEKTLRERAAAMRTEEMLSKPLETFGNQEIENLKNKYQ